MSLDIITHLVGQKTPYEEINSFSNKPGIYALFFIGSDFPLENCKPKQDQIIYIGKTESSQASRDRDTHFADGKTGSSTLRRSFGAMLRKSLNLIPIPRGLADIEKKRTSHYKFDEASEKKLSQWMRANLALSFHEHNGSLSALDELETRLIQMQVPLLNIDRKNQGNPSKSIISALRKETGMIAYGDPHSDPSPKKKIVKATAPRAISADVHKYEDIWKQVIPTILDALKEGRSTDIYIGKAPFAAVGNRKSYTFNLELNNGQVANNISGSAVARDLARVLSNHSEFMKLSKGRQLIIRLDKQFTLQVKS
ncbi:GIY-YIG nuclease family protein [Roseivirga sp.]|uniref:GIY-YIG nuclease family protein n=1 Tax=Roseivirga sp. TaxID=1964215 RepID=UPI002B265F44|nr:hypothetical protein [Roseivirga sp.]